MIVQSPYSTRSAQLLLAALLSLHAERTQAQGVDQSAASPDAIVSDPSLPQESAQSLPSSGPSLSSSPSLSTLVRAIRPIDKIPGTVALITQSDIRRQAAQSSADVLRSVPGLHVVSEEGIGLRLNIGIRGLDPNRSRKVLVLEDGVPITLNPYGVPEQYYTPPIERMERIEVLKGSGQILYGPQTIGGVINFLSRDPPSDLAARADVRYGSFGYVLAQAGIGATHGSVGWQVDVSHRRFDGPRKLDLALTDATAKLRLQLSQTSVLRVKLSVYDESSAATYLGPTTAQFAHDPYLNLAHNDRFLVRRYAASVTHQQWLRESLQLQTVLYGYHTARAWRRQEYDRQDQGIPYERICDEQARCGLRGSPEIRPTSDGGSVYFRSSSVIRNRQYEVAGIEPRLLWNWKASSAFKGELTALVRLHYERAREQILGTETPTDLSGDIRDDELRHGYAVAAAIQNRFALWDRLFVTPGVRIENYFSDRRVLRQQVRQPDGTMASRNTDSLGEAFSFAAIPGIGVSAKVIDPMTLYAGVHRGYAPPRSKDAVSPSGQDLQLDPELSWNSELGTRLQVGRWLSFEATGFWLEFENQIIPPSESGGAVSAGSFNAGRSRHIGLESSGMFDVAGPLGWSALSIPISFGYTFVPMAMFVGGINDGLRLPYAPMHQLNAQYRVAHRIGIEAQVQLGYVGKQFADKENTTFSSRDGLVGEIPGYLTIDARIAYTYRRLGLTGYVAGKNLGNQIYIASRAPSGIQPAGYRQVFFGIEWNWQR
ncbi:MAG: TonB-dependent receptor [Myxococcales bacterium]|nr:TonB-dependent receptor [Myxococcales bacterium]